MITPKEAANRIREVKKYEMIIKVKDYDANHYVVEAIPKKDVIPDISVQTMFGVDKNNGEVTSFMLSDNYDKYMNAKTCKFN